MTSRTGSPARYKTRGPTDGVTRSQLQNSPHTPSSSLYSLRTLHHSLGKTTWWLPWCVTSLPSLRFSSTTGPSSHPEVLTSRGPSGYRRYTPVLCQPPPCSPTPTSSRVSPPSRSCPTHFSWPQLSPVPKTLLQELPTTIEELLMSEIHTCFRVLNEDFWTTSHFLLH